MLLRIVAGALVVVGLVILVWGGFDYTSEETGFEAGPIKVDVEKQERFEVPKWVGVVAVVAGAGLLLAGGRLSRRA
jgi:hypothetical protein